jgi:16S rRNA G1207 methylase RsmC
MDETLKSLQADIAFDATLRGQRLRFVSTWGLFSPRRIDDGSRLLVEHADLPDAGRIVDLGCGYGAIGVAAATACPRAEVHLVDKDFVAVEYARRNLEAHSLAHAQAYLSNAFEAVPADVPLAAVLSNLPANVGKEMLSIILLEARRRLAPGGRLEVVTISGLRQFIRRRLEEVFGNYEKVKQARGYTVARAVRE